MNQGIGPHFMSRYFYDFHDKVPYIFSDLIERLDSLHAEHQEGIFRLSGQKSLVASLCAALDCGRIKDWDQFNDHNVIACAFKKYIRDLSFLDPLIGKDIAETISGSVVKYETDEGIGKAIHDAIASTPTSRRNSLAFVLKYLSKIAHFAQDNKMDSYNLSVCFAPAIFPQTNSLASGNSMKALEFMINHIDSVVEESWYGPDVLMTDADIEKMTEPDVDLEDAINESERRKNRKESAVPFHREDLGTVLLIRRPTREAPILKQ